MAEPDFSLGQPSQFIDKELPAVIARDATRLVDQAAEISIGNSPVEHRQARWTAPLEEWDLGPGVRNLFTMRLVDDFFHEMLGPVNSFKFHNRDWHTTGTPPDLKSLAPNAPAMTDASFGTGDGVTTDFQLGILRGQSFKPVFKTKSTPLIAVGGVFQDPGASPAPYTISSTGLVQFPSAPGNGLALTWGGTYYIVVRFRDARLSTNFVGYRRGEMSLILREARDF